MQQIASGAVRRQVQAPGGVNQRAIAAIENALLDIKAKALGVPVYELFGGPVRDAHSGLLVALRLLPRAQPRAGRRRSRCAPTTTSPRSAPR